MKPKSNSHDELLVKDYEEDLEIHDGDNLKEYVDGTITEF